MKKKVLFVATTPFAVNAFLLPHFKLLKNMYNIILCVNTEEYSISDEMPSDIIIKHIDFRRKISLIWDLISFLELYFFVLKCRPVVIHSITPKAGLLAMIVGFCIFIPNRVHTFTGQVWKNEKGFRRNLLKLVDRFVVFLSTCILSDSITQSNFLVKEGIVKIEDIKVLGPGSIAGVNLQKFKKCDTGRRVFRNNLCLSDNTIVFLFVGRINKDKGVLDLLQAYTIVSSKYESVELWIVGPDEENIKSCSEGLLKGCKGIVRWIGKATDPQKFMVAADVLVLPSYREGFGSVIIEAAACGIPTLAYDIDGVVDAVIHNKTGILVPLKNVSLLASKMLQLARNDDFRLDLARNAHERVTNLFSENMVVNAWASFYQDMIGSSS